MNDPKWLRQVDPAKGYYLAGFADGEGSFNVSLRKREDHTIGWQVVLTFNVSQRESHILAQYKRILGCGRIQQRHDGLFMYVVSNPNAINEKVIPFFKRFRFLSQQKKKNFSLFCQISKLVMDKEHLDEAGLRKVIKLREELNKGKGRKRKYNQEDVEKHFQENPQRLHAKPRTFRKEK